MTLALPDGVEWIWHSNFHFPPPPFRKHHLDCRTDPPQCTATMFDIKRSETGSGSSGNDSTKKEKETVAVLEPVTSTRTARIYEDPNVLDDENEGEFGTKRDLKARHVSMIAIAGTIGTGLFLGSGSALANGGPVGFFLGYTIVGCLVGMMMYCLGEM